MPRERPGNPRTRCVHQTAERGRQRWKPIRRARWPGPVQACARGLLADLDQAQMRGAGFSQQAVEGARMFIVHQHVERQLLLPIRQGAAYLDVAQVRTHQHLAAAVAHLGMQSVGINQVNIGQADTVAPDIQLVQQGVGVGQVLSIHGRASRQAQVRIGRNQTGLILRDAASGTRAGQVEVEDGQPDNGSDCLASEMARSRLSGALASDCRVLAGRPSGYRREATWRCLRVGVFSFARFLPVARQ